MNKRNTSLIFSLFALFIGGLFYLKYNDSSSYYEKVKIQIARTDDQINEVLHVTVISPYTYAFYKSDQNVSIAVLETGHNNNIHVFGSVPLSSYEGFTYATGESDEMKQYIAFGIVSNTVITQVKVNDLRSNMIWLNNGTHLWYHIQSSPFNTPLRILALDKNGRTIFQN